MLYFQKGLLNDDSPVSLRARSHRQSGRPGFFRVPPNRGGYRRLGPAPFLSGREQAAYMARKQASDEYVPSETPTYGDGPGHSARSIAETAYFSELEKTRDSR